MALIRPLQLPETPGGVVSPAAAMIVDDGTGVYRANPAQVARSGAVMATMAEAQAGIANDKYMSPLRTSEAIQSQVGAMLIGKVDVSALATTPQAQAGTDDGSWMSPLKTAQAIAALSPVLSVSGRTGDVVLTKADVGLSNVDNTSDLAKPISDDTQAALNLKADNILADDTEDGLMSSIDFNKLAGIEAGAQANTVFSVAGRVGSVVLTKADVGLSSVDDTSDLAKPISTATQSALDGKASNAIAITAGAGLTGGGNLTANRTIALDSAAITSLGLADTAVQPSALGDAAALNVGTTAGTVAAGNHTHPDATTSVAGFMSPADKAKLNGIASGATANQTDAYLLNRANHTGAQAISTVTGLQAALDSKAASSITVSSGAGLTGGGNLTANRTIALSSASLASLALADTAAQAADLGSVAYVDFPAVPAGNVLNDFGNWVPQGGGGGGGLVNSVQSGTGIAVNASDPYNPTVALNSASIASLALADTALQPSIVGAANGIAPLDANAKLALSNLEDAPIPSGSVDGYVLYGSDQLRMWWPLSIDAEPNTMVARDVSGEVSVGAPTANDHATTKLYVDNGLNAKINNSIFTGGQQVLISTSAGTPSRSDTIPANSLVGRPVSGGIRGMTAAEAKTAIGLDNVANLAPADLPVSNATQTALDGKINTSVFTAENQILFSSASGTPAVAAIGANAFVGRGLSGNLGAMTQAQARVALGATFPTSGMLVGRTDTQTLTNKTLTNPTIDGYTEGSATATGAAFSPDITTDTLFYYTTNANTTITLPAPAVGKSFTIVVNYGGAHTLTWAGGARKWPGGVVPTPTSASGKIDVFTFVCVDGSSWLAFQSGANL